MSDESQGPGWWQASDGKWYPPESRPAGPPPGPPQGPGFAPGYGPGLSPAPRFGPGVGPGFGPPGGPGGAGYAMPYQAPRQTESFAVASLVTACVGLLVGCLCGVGWLTGPVAVFLGVQARKRIRESGGRLEGDGVAIAGIVVGGVSCAFLLLWVALLVFWGGSAIWFNTGSG